MNKMKTYFLLKGHTTNEDHEKNEYDEKHMSMKEIAEKWTKGMKNEDGTSGPHWSLAET